MVGDDVPAAAIAETLRAAIGPPLEDVRVFDEFRADQLVPGKRSLAFTLQFRAPDRTLTQADAAELRQRSIDAVAHGHGATLRE